jgi:hypothetical protein
MRTGWIFFREDRLEFRKHWDAAKTDPYLQERANSFPGYHRFITEFAEVSLQFGYMDICDELAARMKKERLPFPPKVKEYYGG